MTISKSWPEGTVLRGMKTHEMLRLAVEYSKIYGDQLNMIDDWVAANQTAPLSPDPLPDELVERHVALIHHATFQNSAADDVIANFRQAVRNAMNAGRAV